MIVTVFRSRLNMQTQEEYRALAIQLSQAVRAMPGYVSHKSYTAEDGERVTVVEFATMEGLRAWAADPDHAAAKRLGREKLFTEYRVQVCEVVRDSADRRQANA